MPDDEPDEKFNAADAVRLIWGTAFVAQSAGSGMGAFSFLAGRSWMAVLVLLPTVKAFDALHHRQGRPDGKPKTRQSASCC